MNNNNFKGTSFTAAFFLLIGLSLAGLIIGSMIGVALLAGKADGGIGDLSSFVKDPANAAALRLTQIISVILSMILPVILIAWLVNRKPFELVGFRMKPYGKQLLIVAAIVFFSVMIAGALGYVNKDIVFFDRWKEEFEKLEKTYAEQVAAMVNLKSFGGFVFSLFLMAILPAIGEEMLFRGGLQNFLTKATHRPWLSIVVISILFSLIHFSFFGFLPRFFLGLVLGAIFYYTQNLWLSVFAHFLNNAFAVTAMYIYVRQGKSLQEAMKDDAASYWGLLFLPIVVFLFGLLKKTTPTTELPAPHLSQNPF